MTSINLKSYYWLYSKVFLLTTIAVSFISAVSFIVGSILAFIVPLIAALSTAQKFVNDQLRAPEITEKKNLVWVSLAITLLTSLALTWASALILFPHVEWKDVFSFFSSEGVVAAIMLVVLIVGFLINYLMLNWAYGSFAATTASDLKKLNE